MQQLARHRSLVAAHMRPVGRSRRSRRFSPCWRRTRHTVEADTPVRADRYTGPRFVLRRCRQSRSSVLASVRRDDQRGRELRSARPASPCSLQRRHLTETLIRLEAPVR